MVGRKELKEGRKVDKTGRSDKKKKKEGRKEG